MHDIHIIDPDIASQLDCSGYAVTSGIDATTVAELQGSVYEEIRFACGEKVNYNTGSDLAGSARSRASQRIKQAFAPFLDRHFLGCECIVSLMFVKRPSALSEGQVCLHCDPTLLPDESRQRHLNIWVPLIDVDETTGALWVVPRSHKVFAPVHAFSVPSQFSQIAETVMDHGACVRMQAGEALIFDNRMPHFSRQNFGPRDRPAVILSIVPSGADFISLFGAEGPEFPVEVYRQPHTWYEDTDWTNDGERPQSGEFLGYLNWMPRALTRNEFIDRLEGRAHVEYGFELRHGAAGAD